jgi:glycosyltransferase involved in cell wall biosynthesis
MSVITFCIPSKNNLRYLKHSIESIKENSTYENDIIVFVDADNDGTVDWLDKKGIQHIINHSEAPLGIAYGYNRCIELAKTPIVCMFHADMYMGVGFDVALVKHLKPKRVVSATRIEPPLHPEGKEKIVKHFGMYPEDFTRKQFDEYVAKLVQDNVDVTTKGIFAPWGIYKEDIVALGMHDEQFHSYHEDSDMFNRFVLAGYDILQTWEGFVYHLTCRGGQFQDGIESVTKDASFHQMKHSSLVKYIRKWGNMIQNDEYHYPIIPPKYNIRASLHNVKHLNQMEVIEPFVTRLLVDSDALKTEFTDRYPDTIDKIGLIQDCVDLTKYPVDVILNADVISQQDVRNLHQLNSMLLELETSNDTGMFEIENITLYVNELKNTLV